MHLVLVDDNSSGLYPFSILHCPWELRCGPMRVVDAWTALLTPTTHEFVADKSLVDSFLARFPQYQNSTVVDDRAVILKSSLVPSKSAGRAIESSADRDCFYVLNDDIVGLSCTVSSWNSTNNRIPTAEQASTLDWPRIDLACHRVNELWQSLDEVAHSIDDAYYSIYSKSDALPLTSTGVIALAAENIIRAENLHIEPFVLLDATKGPIILEDGVRIMAHSVIYGPCYIGHNSIIKAGAKIYPNTVIGEWSKVGGEVENSIIHAYSNKQHEGFLGHSHIGEWVNLGADTNTSDLKNTYGPIRITRRGQEVDSGRMFLGLLCGDHTKSGINTMFNTGTVCGIHANVIGAGYTPTEIPSFAWGAIADSRHMPLRKALSIARTVMKRRNKELLAEEEVLMSLEAERIQS